MPIIKKVITKEEGLRPILADFQNGKVSFEEANNNFESLLYRNNEGKIVVGVTNSKVLYSGLINDKNDLYNNFILIHNKTTGKARLIQVDYCTVSPLLNKKNDLLNVSMETTENSVSELNKKFGSKKSKRHTEHQEHMKMNAGTAQEQLEKTLTVLDVNVDETDLSLATSNENNSLHKPKINRDASRVEEVYNLEDIVPESVLDSLQDDAMKIAKGADLTQYNLSSFVSSNISEILASSSGDIILQRITIFLYINYLLKFMNTPMKNITKKFVVCDKSSEVNQHILDNYSFHTGHSRTRPLSMKDKALCSIIVLAALAMNYHVNIETLSKDFKTGLKKVLEISRILAFIPSGKNKSTVVLKLPLPQSVSFSLKRKRK